MKLIDINTQPTPRQLRQFASAIAVAVPVLAWFSGASTTALSLAALLSLLIAAFALWRPTVIRIPFIALSLLLAPLGLIVGEIALLTIYFGILFPISIGLRAIGRDSLQLRIERSSRTYWQRKSVPQDPKSYFRRH